MLVLNRRKSQGVLIKWMGEVIRVVVIRSGERNVKLGFDLPKEAVVIREELELEEAIRNVEGVTL